MTSLSGDMGQGSYKGSNFMESIYSGMKNPSNSSTMKRGFKEKTPKGYSSGRLQNATPEQMDLWDQGNENVGPDSYLYKLAAGDEDLFNEMEAPAYRDFSALQGNIASRFSGGGGGQGALGSRRSSAFQNQTNQAASNFAQDLQSKRNELKQQARKDLHQMSQDLIGNNLYDNYMVEKPKPFWQSAATSFAHGAGQGATKAATAAFGG